jgi:hypothetical protein
MNPYSRDRWSRRMDRCAEMGCAEMGCGEMGCGEMIRDSRPC